MTQRVTMMARITPKAGKADIIRPVLEGMVGPTRQEAGCIAYNLHEYGGENGPRFSFYEIWQSRHALNQHMQTPHIKAFIDRLDELVEGDIDIEEMTLIDR